MIAASFRKTQKGRQHLSWNQNIDGLFKRGNRNRSRRERQAMAIEAAMLSIDVSSFRRAPARVVLTDSDDTATEAFSIGRASTTISNLVVGL